MEIKDVIDLLHALKSRNYEIDSVVLSRQANDSVLSDPEVFDGKFKVSTSTNGKYITKIWDFFTVIDPDAKNDVVQIIFRDNNGFLRSKAIVNLF